MNKLKCSFLILLFLYHVAYGQHFIPVTPTGKYCPIIIQDAKISGERIFPGDEIAVFNDTLCVGGASYDGSFPISFSASMKVLLPNLTVLPGAVEQDTMIFKIYQVSSDQELDAKSFYQTGGIFYEGLPTVVSLLDAVELLPPLADAGGPYAGYEGSPIYFNGSNSHDPDGNIFLYEWDWDYNGIFDVSTSIDTITYTWLDDYVGIITLQIQDNDGLSDQDEASVLVLNVPPIVHAGSDLSKIPNMLVTLDSATFSDPGMSNDVYEVTLDWGDGIVESGSFQQISDYYKISAEHSFQQTGSYSVKIVVSDGDGGIGKDSLTVNVEDAAPLVNWPVLNIPEDDSLEISLSDINFYIIDNHYGLSELDIQFLGDTSHFNYTFDVTEGLTIWPNPENWNGVFELILSVSNPLGYFGIDTTQVTVTPVNDPPMPFELISPPDSTLINDLRKSIEIQTNIIQFIWSQSKNVDKDNGDSIVYDFYLGVDPLPQNNRLMITTVDTSYQYDSGGQMGADSYFWSVKASDQQSLTTWASDTWSLINFTGIHDQTDISIPATFGLYQNYPNPFNPETIIKYEIPSEGWVSIKIFNTQGQLVRTLIDQEVSSGSHNVIWNGLDDHGISVSCGLYIYSLSHDNHFHLRKMMLIK